MDEKNKTVREIEKKLHKIERLIAEKGVGSEYLSRAEQIQRDLNIALLAGSLGLVAGIGIWAWIQLRD